MSYFYSSGCKYRTDHKFISDPLMSFPSSGKFIKADYYQSYNDYYQQKWNERSQRYEKEHSWENFFKGFFGFKEREESKDKDYPYSVFGLKKSSSNDDMKKAYRKAILKTHPDKGGSSEAFRRVKEAWDYFSSKY